MGLETATYINQLSVANPTLSDPISQGDDHIRLIKTTLKNTFPNITANVTCNQSQLNRLTLDGVMNTAGMICLFPSPYAIPAGWVRCDGTSTTLGPSPNLTAIEPSGCIYIIKL